MISRSASIEWLDAPGGVLRVHAAGEGYGDPYDWCCTVEAIGKLAILRGVLAAPSPSQWRAMVDALREAGFARARWVRVGRRVVDWRL